MTEYNEIKTALSRTFEKYGLKLVEENDHPDDYGSIYSIFSNRIMSYRILWDEKDGCGYLQVKSKDQWLNLKAVAPEGEQVAFSSAVTSMRIKLIEHIALSRLNKD